MDSGSIINHTADRCLIRKAQTILQDMICVTVSIITLTVEPYTGLKVYMPKSTAVLCTGVRAVVVGFVVDAPRCGWKPSASEGVLMRL